ncbi:acyl-CoA dehydrogenase [soil metagenome]
MHASLSPIRHAPGPLTARVLDEQPIDVASALRLAQQLGASAPSPGDGSTLDLWEALATLAAHDLGAARAIEPHLDAVAILNQARAEASGSAWGVFAAEGGSDPLVASASGDGWLLSGTKPWCSLADRLDAALITAADDTGVRRLFAVDLHDSGVHPQPGTWVARGLSEIPSGPVSFDRVPAAAIGEPGWYLTRAGFAWGGIGVAACWWGGAVGVARTLYDAVASKPEPLLLAQLGAVDELLESARRALAEAVELVDGPEAAEIDGKVLAKRVRGTVARSCEEILLRAGHALGPAPLALDDAHAKRVADLQLYLRQHHAERDDASLGSALVGSGRPW